MTTTLVLGGARAGKSRHALALAAEADGSRVFVATATPSDADMEDRIAQHRADRGPGWETVEEPLEVPATVAARTRPDGVVVVDCLTLWLSNLLVADRDVAVAVEDLVAALEQARGPVVVVTNELGMGVHPPTDLGRRFRDAHGRMNQRVAAACDEVVLVVAGLPVTVKGGRRA